MRGFLGVGVKGLLVSKSGVGKPQTSGLSRRPQLRKVADLHRSIRKAGNDVQLAAHGFNVAAQRGQVHVGALFHFGNGWLLHVEDFGEHFLRQATCLAQFVKRHFQQHGFGLFVGLLACSHALGCATSQKHPCNYRSKTP